MKARRGWAWPLVPLYAAGLAVKDGLRAAGVLRTQQLAWPVVSVGSLSAGGAGKTPVVIALAELLQVRGWGVDVLSRGYGRSGRGVERVDGSAEKQILHSAQDDNVLPEDGDAAGRFGDEPVLIARRAEVPVWVGADRFAAGMAAEQQQQQGQGREADSSAALRNDKGGALRNDKGGALLSDKGGALRNDNPIKVHLLDDGFQHRGLGRAVDVVLVTAEDLEDALLPAGNRRERLRALRRADVVVVREEERERVESRVRTWMRAEAQVWSVRRELRVADEAFVAGARLVAFCAIARPDGFFSMLNHNGCDPVGTVAFGDHHSNAMADIERLMKVGAEQKATGFITTEKDAVKLTAQMRGRLETIGPLVVARLDAVFVDAAAVVKDLEGRIG